MMAKKLIITRCADCMYYMDGGGEMDVCDRMDKVMHIEPYTAIDPAARYRMRTPPRMIAVGLNRYVNR